MTNNTNTTAPLSHAARLALYSAATPTITMPDAPIRRPAPRSRRNSVPHRSIR